MISAKGETLGMDEMAAILDGGFDDLPPVSYRPPQMGQAYVGSPLNRPAHQPYANGNGNGNGHWHEPYTPNSAIPNTGDSVSSSVESRAGQGHAKKRSGGAGVDRYGPLGPLADDDVSWARPNGNPFTGRKL